MTNRDRIEQLYQTSNLDEGLMALLVSMDKEDFDHLCKRACEVREKVYGREVYLRGLIEFSNYCRNDCYYCGIRRSNRLADRYRLSENEIVACSDAGYELGFRTFVLQSGEAETGIRTARSRFPSGRKAEASIRPITMPGQSGICSGKKHPTRSITENFIHRGFPSRTASAACMTFGRSAIRLGAGSWSGHRGRHRNISSRIFDSCRSWILR